MFIKFVFILGGNGWHAGAAFRRRVQGVAQATEEESSRIIWDGEETNQSKRSTLISFPLFWVCCLQILNCCFQSSPSNPALSRTSNSEVDLDHQPRSRAHLKASVSFSGLRTEDSWTPEPMEHGVHRNPFFDDDNEVHPVAQQYIIIKG